MVKTNKLKLLSELYQLSPDELRIRMMMSPKFQFLKVERVFSDGDYIIDTFRWFGKLK